LNENTVVDEGVNERDQHAISTENEIPWEKTMITQGETF
jgi:hypothetical protein